MMVTKRAGRMKYETKALLALNALRRNAKER